MSRIYKFRAWDKKQKNWLFDFKKIGGFSLVGETVMLGEWSGIPLARLKDIEVMQYTGLKDKNGVEIYEGDIVKDYRVENSEAVIEYCQPIAAFVARPIVKAPHDVYQLNQGNTVGELQLTHTEVIGNIYENPELLEDK